MEKTISNEEFQKLLDILNKYTNIALKKNPENPNEYLEKTYGEKYHMLKKAVITQGNKFLKMKIFIPLFCKTDDDYNFINGYLDGPGRQEYVDCFHKLSRAFNVNECEKSCLELRDSLIMKLFNHRYL